MSSLPTGMRRSGSAGLQHRTASSPSASDTQSESPSCPTGGSSGSKHGWAAQLGQLVVKLGPPAAWRGPWGRGTALRERHCPRQLAPQQGPIWCGLLPRGRQNLHLFLLFPSHVCQGEVFLSALRSDTSGCGHCTRWWWHCPWEPAEHCV